MGRWIASGSPRWTRPCGSCCRRRAFRRSSHGRPFHDPAGRRRAVRRAGADRAGDADAPARKRGRQHHETAFAAAALEAFPRAARRPACAPGDEGDAHAVRTLGRSTQVSRHGRPRRADRRRRRPARPSAKCEEAGGVDLIVITIRPLPHGRARLARRDDGYGDANAIVYGEAAEVLPVVKHRRCSPRERHRPFRAWTCSSTK